MPLLLALLACNAENTTSSAAPTPAVAPAAAPASAANPAPSAPTLAPAATATADAAPTANTGSSATGPDTWTAGRLEGPGVSVPATAVAVRTGRHDGFDRLVLEFDVATPRWKAEYVDKPVRRCGSGEAVPVAGDGWLELRLEPSRAHTEAGAPTTPRESTPNLPNLLEIERTCDFEAVTTWVLGVRAPNPFRVFTLDAPPRIVVDVRQ